MKAWASGTLAPAAVFLGSNSIMGHRGDLIRLPGDWYALHSCSEWRGEVRELCLQTSSIVIVEHGVSVLTDYHPDLCWLDKYYNFLFDV